MAQKNITTKIEKKQHAEIFQSRMLCFFKRLMRELPETADIKVFYPVIYRGNTSILMYFK